MITISDQLKLISGRLTESFTWLTIKKKLSRKRPLRVCICSLSKRYFKRMEEEPGVIMAALLYCLWILKHPGLPPWIFLLKYCPAILSFLIRIPIRMLSGLLYQEICLHRNCFTFIPPSYGLTAGLPCNMMMSNWKGLSCSAIISDGSQHGTVTEICLKKIARSFRIISGKLRIEEKRPGSGLHPIMNRHGEPCLNWVWVM